MSGDMSLDKSGAGGSAAGAGADRPPKERIGFIGIGLMGHGIARNLLARGHPLVFRAHRNRSNLADLLDAGAREATTPAEVARESDLVFICVTGTPQVEATVFGEHGLLAGVRRGQTVIDCSTSEPASTARIRAAFAERGVEFVDAPLARTPKEAEEGRLNTMVGADAATFARLMPVFKAFCENVIHAGPPGHGHTLKLVNNFLALSIAASTAEAFAVAARSGLSLARFHAVLSAGGVNSGVYQMIAGKAVEGDFTGMKFSIGNGRKDMHYYTHLAESLGVASFIGEAVHQSLVQASGLGFADRFLPSLIEAQEKLNSFQIVPRPA